MDFKICWKCKGLSSEGKLTSNQMDNHRKQCPGLGMSTIFDYYICDKTDYFALLEIKQCLNKDVCNRLQSRETTQRKLTRDLPDVVIELLLKLSFSKMDEAPQRNAFVSSPTKSSTIRLSKGENLASNSVLNQSCASNTESSIFSDASSPSVSRICVTEIPSNLLTQEEEKKLSKECRVIKKGNFEELICQICNYQSKFKKIMLRHLNSHDNGQVFQCRECKFTTPMRSKWNLHQCNRQGRNLVCHLCSEQFHSQSTLNRHLATMHSEKVNTQIIKGRQQLHCDCCDYIARDQASLKEHQRKHTGETITCPHENCTFKSLYKRSLQKHLQQKHSKEKTQICEVCGFQTRHASSLKKHMMLHEGSKQYKCAECSYSCFSPSEVLLHVQRKHLKRKNHSCPKCPFQSSYLFALKKHIARHDRNETDEMKVKKKTVKSRTLKHYCCSVCGDVLNSMNKAKEHIQKFHCTEEFQITNDISALKSHEEKNECLPEPNSFSEKNMNFDNLLDVDISSDEDISAHVLDMTSNILNSQVTRNDSYVPEAVNMSLPSEPICRDVFDNDDAQSSVSRNGGNPMLSATSDVLADIDNSFLEDSLFDLMSDLPRPPTLNRCQSASSLMFASLSQHMVDRPLTPDFFTDIPTQSFFQNFPSRGMDQDHFTVGSLNQPFQMSTGFSSQIEISANPAIINKPLSPIIPSFTCFHALHPTPQSSVNLPSPVDPETAITITDCLLEDEQL